MGRGWFGGDRGFNYPELTVLALGSLIHNLPAHCHDGDATPLMTKLPQSRLLHPGGAFSLCLWLGFSGLSAKLGHPEYLRTRQDDFASFQPELAVYHNDLQDYSINEPTMEGIASAILMFALYAEETKERKP